MSILDLYNNPETATNPDAARQIRFKGNESDKLQDSYKAYSVNDKTSLQLSQLHSEGPEQGPKELGYSTDGTPTAQNLGLNNQLYDATAKLPSQIASNQVINGPAGSGHTQNYTSNAGYITAEIDALLAQNLSNEVFL